MDVLYDRNVTCLVCKKNYTTKKVRSRFIRPIRHDTDFCSYYESEETNPLLYYVHVCPHCGFAATEEFSPYFPPTTLETIEKQICAQWSGKNYGGKRTFQEATNTYKLGIYSATLKKEKHITIAGLYIRLAWLYRSKEMKAEEERFMRLALEEYLASYQTDDFAHTHMSEVRLLYLIGELYRRLNNEKQAILYFSKVIGKRNETIEKGIVNMAYERWQEIREARQE
ncbi:hypothetical protein EDD69_11239 [Thermolongibacillus altinsuensis]|jgi:uncharacterized protein (DUF2225 family)|uniref:DUF2225 domain-containing protein n=1 Tax=Thermolongibacillus altinsuensis TaxID=575256 RepID=A0A4R1QD20_9BACL|nr:DUF2225 domain-containing protein [Thermolongibacillus altinsuensis]TCL47329.1 hypothetical protein EDD69_11239 [Thermolongibacillus altinsuensis]GMB09013.1 hypothetical protein B1no1_17230 [Thermolongibacillus altinsuensis]